MNSLQKRKTMVGGKKIAINKNVPIIIEKFYLLKTA
jgi:hypothetical protein